MKKHRYKSSDAKALITVSVWELFKNRESEISLVAPVAPSSIPEGERPRCRIRELALRNGWRAPS
jgi:hypothetical protein